MCQVNPIKASKEKTTIMLPYNKKQRMIFFKGSLSNLSHLRQVMLQQKSLSILSKIHQA
jgi:hypothetical protein